MGGILCKCFGKCFGGGEEPAQTLSSATDVRVPLVSAHGFGEEPAMDVTQSFVYKVTAKRFSLDHDTLGNTDDTLGNTDELKLELLKNPQVNSIIVEYLETSFYTDDFFSSIDECLQKAQSNADLLFEAVNSFENKKFTSSLLESLRKFTVHDNTFPQVVDNFKRQLENQFSRIQKLSEQLNDLGQKLGNVSCWKVVCSGVYCVATVGLSIGSAVLVIMSIRQVSMKYFDPGHKALARLDSEISGLLDEFKSSLKGKRDTTVDLLKETVEKLSRIRAFMQQTSRGIEELNGIKARVHEHVGVYIKSVEENAEFGIGWGNDEEVNRNMTTATHGIKTEANRLKTIVERLKEEVNRRRDDLKTAVATILKAVEQDKNEFVCCCCSCCC